MDNEENTPQKNAALVRLERTISPATTALTDAIGSEKWHCDRCGADMNDPSVEGYNVEDQDGPETYACGHCWFHGFWKKTNNN